MIRYIWPLLLVSAASVTVEGQVAEGDAVEMELDLVYYVCIDPAAEPGEPPCVSDSQSTEDCPSCEAWDEETANEVASVSLAADAYSYSSGPPRANVFLRDVALQAYGVALPEQNGWPILVGDLYRDPAAYGWIDVSDGEDKEGTIVVWPTIAGLVVEEDIGPPEVLYPSHSLEGKLNITSADELVEGVAPRYLLPREMLTAPTAVEPAETPRQEP